MSSARWRQRQDVVLRLTGPSVSGPVRPSGPVNRLTVNNPTTYIHMHTNVILTNKRRTHAQSNYINTKLKAWFRRLLRHLARKRAFQFVIHVKSTFQVTTPI